MADRDPYTDEQGEPRPNWERELIQAAQSHGRRIRQDIEELAGSLAVEQINESLFKLVGDNGEEIAVSVRADTSVGLLLDYSFYVRGAQGNSRELGTASRQSSGLHPLDRIGGFLAGHSGTKNRLVCALSENGIRREASPELLTEALAQYVIEAGALSPADEVTRPALESVSGGADRPTLQPLDSDIPVVAYSQGIETSGHDH